LSCCWVCCASHQTATHCFASYQAQESEGCLSHHYVCYACYRTATWPRRRKETSFGNWTATRPRRRRKATLLCWGKTCCCGGKMKFVGRKVIPWIVDLGAMNAFVSKLRWKLDQVRHTKWKDRQGEQGPDRNVSQCPIRQVEYPDDTGRPPVGNIVKKNLSSKLGQGRWGSPFCGRASPR
jgi:hypothetical protein